MHIADEINKLIKHVHIPNIFNVVNNCDWTMIYFSSLFINILQGKRKIYDVTLVNNMLLCINDY